MGKEGEMPVKGNEEVEVMLDTPERSKIGWIATGLGTSEDSPVYNFLNNLSPIKPVKPLRITETINPLCLASPPSVFTSPHVTSLREPRFLRRHQVLDQSKLEFSLGNDDSIDIGKAKMRVMKQMGEQREDLDPDASHYKVADETPVECANLRVDQEENFISYCNDTCSSLRPSSLNNMAEFSCSSSALVRGTEMNAVEEDKIDQSKKEVTSCEWDNLIVDASDMLIYESPNDAVSYKKPLDSYSRFFSDNANDSSFVDDHVDERSAQENLCTQSGEGNENWEDAEMQDTVSSPLVSNPTEKMDYEIHSGLYRGIRRRCLDYEMEGSLRNHVDDKSIPNSTVFGQSDCNLLANSGSRLVSTNESPHCALPSIGLHLNAIGTLKNYKFVNHDSSASSGRILIRPSLASNLDSTTIDQDLLTNPLSMSSMEGENDTLEDVIPAMDDSQTSECVTNDEIKHCSPKKKRSRMEQAREGDSCKRCNCKKSKCLKLYCECFAAGVYCVEPCSCIDCFNLPIHEETVLSTRKQIESRNPLAFAPKVIRGIESLTETGEETNNTPASARHKRGCNCKKSGCLKKYCECYQSGVGCSVNCRCEGCKNLFGRKDGTEVEYEDETDPAAKNMVSKSFHKTSIHIDSDRDMDSPTPTPATPILSGRQPVKPLFPNRKQPRFSFPSHGSSSIYASQAFGTPRFFQPPPKFDSQLETVNEDEVPDFLIENSPISSGIKSSSPNSKRVSPPRIVAGTSPAGLKSSRKLILQSISSFPSLSSNQ